MDGTIGAVVALAGLAAIGAFLALLGWRNERAERAAAQAEVERLGAEVAAVQRAAADAVRSGRGRGEELAELRRKLEKARKRAFAAQEERAPLEARIAELEARLGDREQEAAGLRGRLEALHEEREAGGRELARLREDLARAEKSAAEARIDPAEHAMQRQRMLAAEEEVRRLQPLLREAEHEAGRWRQRERVQRRAYTVLRGELEIARDHIRALRGEGGIEVDDGAEAALGDGAPAQSTRPGPV